MYRTDLEPDPARVTVSEARRTFADLVNRVAYGNERFTIVRHGRAVAAIVPMSDVRHLDAVDVDARAGDRAARTAKPSPNRRGAGPRP
jgi:prevent-host-death family protein